MGSVVAGGGAWTLIKPPLREECAGIESVPLSTAVVNVQLSPIIKPTFILSLFPLLPALMNCPLLLGSGIFTPALSPPVGLFPESSQLLSETAFKQFVGPIA